MKAGIIDEMMSDAIDGAVDTEDMEDETDAEVDRVRKELQSLKTLYGRLSHATSNLIHDGSNVVGAVDMEDGTDIEVDRVRTSVCCGDRFVKIVYST